VDCGWSCLSAENQQHAPINGRKILSRDSYSLFWPIYSAASTVKPVRSAFYSLSGKLNHLILVFYSAFILTSSKKRDENPKFIDTELLAIRNSYFIYCGINLFFCVNF